MTASLQSLRNSEQKARSLKYTRHVKEKIYFTNSILAFYFFTSIFSFFFNLFLLHTFVLLDTFSCTRNVPCFRVSFILLSRCTMDWASVDVPPSPREISNDWTRLSLWSVVQMLVPAVDQLDSRWGQIVNWWIVL